MSHLIEHLTRASTIARLQIILKGLREYGIIEDYEDRLWLSEIVKPLVGVVTGGSSDIANPPFGVRDAQATLLRILVERGVDPRPYITKLAALYEPLRAQFPNNTIDVEVVSHLAQDLLEALWQ